MTISLITHRQRHAISLSNGVVRVIVLLGGGHIASVTRHDDDERINPLWEPSWDGFEPFERTFADPSVVGDSLEGNFLPTIAGHNLCCDVFGAHSEGEVKAGMTFHGEAGMVMWTVHEHHTSEDGVTCKIGASLKHSNLTVLREFRLSTGSSTVRVKETVINQVGFERVFGVAQHVTVGRGLLADSSQPTLWNCNADKGNTWPQPNSDNAYGFKQDTPFDWPTIPSQDDSHQDWRTYPRHAVNSDLCTLRIKPTDSVGWFSAYQPHTGNCLSYAWERKAYPWLMTWEENQSRDEKPWNGKELTRGLEFTSYAFATSRRDNVQRSRLLDTPCHDWLDAYEIKTTEFAFDWQTLESGLGDAPVVNWSPGEHITF